MRSIHIGITAVIASVSIVIIMILTPNIIPQFSSNRPVTCSTNISPHNQTVALDLQQKAIFFIENNTTEFKSLNHKYHMAVLGTRYAWGIDPPTCVTVLKGITVTFEMSNATSPFVGESDVTVDQSVTKITSVIVDIPSVAVPPTCTDKACRVAHGIFN